VFDINSLSEADWALLVQGLMATCKISLISLLIAVPLGCLLGFARYANLPVLSSLVGWVIDGIRIVPLILYLVLMFLVLPFDPEIRAIFTLATFNGANIAEIIRGGLRAIPDSQWQTAKQLGLSSKQTLFSVVLPQVFQKMLPALVNQASVIIKDSTLVSMGVLEMTKAIQILNMRHIESTMACLILTGGVYFILSALLCELTNRWDTPPVKPCLA
jgi:His/Glu/Gln/Arg/opine family amino acid ABC transporter permease subunit